MVAVGFIVAIFLIVGVSALDFENQQRWDFGHVIIFSNLSTMPTTLEPGIPGIFCNAKTINLVLLL